MLCALQEGIKMEYVKAFLVGGAICLIGQILIDKTKLTPARILVSYVVIGVILGGIGIYEPIKEFAGAGITATVNGMVFKGILGFLLGTKTLWFFIVLSVLFVAGCLLSAFGIIKNMCLRK